MPEHLPPIDREDQDQIDSPHLDLPPVVLINPTPKTGGPVARVQNIGKPFLKIGLDTFRLSFPRIIMGRDMELGFMGGS